jgi:hypothetical protein
MLTFKFNSAACYKTVDFSTAASPSGIMSPYNRFPDKENQSYFENDKKHKIF